MASNLNIMAPAKLAEFRYGREEMLALFTLPDEYDSPLRLYQEYVIKKAGLLVDRPDIPLNLSRSMSEEEQRAWQKGANSDTSLRLYRKEMPPGSMPGGPGMGRGAPGERGRGRGRGGSGYFDRQRPPVQDEEDGGATPGNRSKSTRLNSSHITISYAVFCLKKKKNKHHLPRAETPNSDIQLQTDHSCSLPQ